MTEPARTLIAAHRGGTHLWPENSPTAFRNTAALAVDYVEFDVHRTADGVLVVHHDATIDRMTDTKGAIRDMTFADLREALILGTAGERIPTLEEVVAIFRPSPVDLRLELKNGPEMARYAGIEAEVADLLRREAMLARTLVTSFDASNLFRFRQALRPGEALRGHLWLVAEVVLSCCGPEGVIAVARAHGLDEIGLRIADLDEGSMARYRAAGLTVHAWAAHSRRAAETCFALGVASFTTDRPDIALAVAAARR
jgi:glycerophosphoryl diester phosphodiesterase